MDNITKGQIIQCILASKFSDSNERIRLVEEFLSSQKQKTKEIIREVEKPCPFPHQYPNDLTSPNTIPFQKSFIHMIDLNNPPLVIHDR